VKHGAAALKYADKTRGGLLRHQPSWFAHASPKVPKVPAFPISGFPGERKPLTTSRSNVADKSSAVSKSEPSDA
jgi:hypothetical protein